MMLVSSETELTTAATDLLLTFLCIALAARLGRPGTADAGRVRLWRWVFGLTACGSALGAVAHAFALPPLPAALIWRPIYLALGLAVGLFLIGAVRDGFGPKRAARLLPWGLGAGCAALAATEFMRGEFIAFVVYEALAMLGALAIYAGLAWRRRRPGAGLIALAIMMNLAAAGVQATPVALTVGVRLDHNGVFHLVQMMALAVLWAGLARGMAPVQGVSTSMR